MLRFAKQSVWGTVAARKSDVPFTERLATRSPPRLPLMKNRFALAGGLTLVVLAVVAVAAPWISPHDPLAVNLSDALLPIVTILGLSLPDLIAGSVIMETVFSIPGMGRLFYDAVMERDHHIIMALVTIGAVLTLLGNLLADVAYAVADPRIRAGGRS